MQKFVIIICVLGLSTGLLAQDGEAGLESPFSIGVGARGLGLGGASVGFPEDASAFFWNPAGMQMVQRKNVLLSQTTLFEGVQYHFIGYVHPTISTGTFGFGISRIGTGGIRAFDEVQGVSIEMGEFDYWWGKLSIAYAYPLIGGLALGVNFEANRQVMGTSYATNGFGLDTGIHYAIRSQNSFLNGFMLGLNIKNAFNPRLKLGSQSENLQERFRSGIAKVFPLRQGHDRWIFLADLDWMDDRKTRFHIGSEYSLDQTVFLRVGLDDGEATFGGGLKYRAVQLDYATGHIGDPEFFSRSHRFSISFHIGRSIQEKLDEDRLAREQELDRKLQLKFEEERQKRINDALKAGQDFFRRGDYFNARLEFSRVLSEDKTNRRALDMLTATAEREQARQQAREDSLLQVEREKIQTKQNMDYVNTRLQEGNRLLQQGRFQQAIEKWEEALLADPQNPTILRYVEQAKNQLENQINQTIARARSYMRQENLTEARNLLAQARSLAAGNAGLENKVDREIRELSLRVDFNSSYQAGLERYNNKQYEAAIPYFKRALEIQPENERVKTLYTNAIARSKKDEEEPVSEEVRREVIQKINEGVSLYRDDRYQDALRVWEEALKLDPHNVNLLQAIEGAKRKLQTFENQR